MAAFEKLDKLMQRMGFVRLQRYGLLLTPDDRVVSLRPAVLDDGLGARVVGWRDNDLASAELPAWNPAGPPTPAPQRRLAPPPPPPRAALMISPVATPGPLAPMPMFASPPAAFAPEATHYAATPIVKTPRVSTSPVEEDWEWTLAAARARAADAPVAAAAAPVAAAPAAQAPVAPKTAPLRRVTPAPAEPRSPQPHLIEAAGSERTTDVTPAQPVVASTVIPIPTLPRIAQSSSTSLYRPEPVVRAPASPSSLPVQPRRLARGTRPVDKDVTHTEIAAPAPALGTETRTQISAAPAPAPVASAKPGGIPSIKQRMAGR
jgi:hypothetical protein